MDGEWDRLKDKEIGGCKVFVRSSSYTVMAPLDRERVWTEEVQIEASRVASWLRAFGDTAVRNAHDNELDTVRPLLWDYRKSGKS